MPVTVRLMLNNTEPLKRARVRYRSGPRSAKWVHQFTDDAGNLSMNRNPRRGARTINVRVYAENPVVRVTRGMGRAHRVAFENTGVRDGQTIVVPGGATGEHFVIANTAYDLYQGRFFRFLPRENPLGSSAANTDRRIRVRWPGETVGSSFTHPTGKLRSFPTIHLSRTEIVDPATGAIDDDELRRSLVSELSHAIHFGHFGIARRCEIAARYFVGLGIESVQDVVNARPVTWRAGEALTPMMAFLEAFDIFFRRYDAAIVALAPDPDASAVAGITALLATGDDGTVATGPAPTGANVPARVCAVIFVNYAGSPGIGPEMAVDQYIQSRALTYNAFARWVRRRFGANSSQFTSLVAAALPHGM